MLDTYIVSFFGHRIVYDSGKVERYLEKIIYKLIDEKEYVNFLVGRNGDFDIIVASIIKRIKKEYKDDNSWLTLVLTSQTKEYIDNEENYHEYYDEIDIYPVVCDAYYKRKIQVRNEQMISFSNLVVCYVEEKQGGAYKAMKYAEKSNKKVINIAEIKEE